MLHQAFKTSWAISQSMLCGKNMTKIKIQASLNYFSWTLYDISSGWIQTLSK